MTLRRFLSLFALAALIAAAALLVFNALRGRRDADERNIVERLVARQIAEGHSVIPPPGLDEAALRWHVAQELTKAPAVGVLGSSHSLHLSGPMLGVHGLQNFSISGGDMTEHIVTTTLLERRGLSPRVWVIVVDPWYFDRSTDFGMWKLRGAVLVAAERRLDQAAKPHIPAIFGPRWHPPAEATLSERFSITPLVDWLDDIARRLAYRPTVVDPSKSDLPFLILRSDGAYQVTPDSDHAGDDSTELARRQFVQDIDRHRYGSYERIDADLWMLFERWIDACQASGSRVILVLTPYHPSIYPKIVARPDNQLQKIERMVRAFASRQHLPLFGSYDPSKLGMTAADFFDGDHLDDAGLRRLCAPMAPVVRADLDKEKAAR